MKQIIHDIKQRIAAPEKRPLLESFISLSALNVMNYLFPLITVPYTVRVLGVEKFGLINFAQAFIQYFVIITDYGFNLSATQEIARNRANKEKISHIFSAVFVIKSVFMILCCGVMGLVISYVPKFGSDPLLYIYSFGAVLSSVLFPIWFFQGMERMRYITILNTLFRVLFTLMLFLFVKRPTDYLIVPLLSSLGGIIVGLASLYIIFTSFPVVLTKPRLSDIKEELSGGWHIFISQISISLYSVSNTFILGLLTNNTQVGYYAGVEKIIKIVKSLMGSITQSLFPYINARVEQSKDAGIIIVRKIIKPLSGAFLLISIGMFIGAPLIIRLILGSNFEASVPILQAMSFIPLLVLLSNMMGIQVMLPLNYKRQFSRIIIGAGAVNVLLLFALIPTFQSRGVGIAVLITEVSVTVAEYAYLRKKGISLFT